MIVYLSRLTRFDLNGCYLNSAQCFLDAGHNVAFVIAKESGVTLSFPGTIEQTVDVRAVVYRWKFAKFVNMMGKYSSMVRKYAFVVFYLIMACAKITRFPREAILIATDAPSLAVACLLMRFRSVVVVYYPQELYLEEDADIVYPMFWSKIEARLAKKAMLTIAFDEERARLYKDRRNIHEKDMVIIPNSITGRPKMIQRGYWHGRFGLAESVKIIMFSGGVDAPYNMLNEILNTVEQWASDCVLVVHSLSGHIQNQRLADELYRRKLNNRVYISYGGKLSYDDLFDLYAGADIGLAIYGKQTLNHWYAGFSSGKMWQFLRAGVQVIVNNTALLRAEIEENGAGCCIENAMELPNVIAQLKERGKVNQDACYAVFERNEFRCHHAFLESRIARL